MIGKRTRKFNGKLFIYVASYNDPEMTAICKKGLKSQGYNIRVEKVKLKSNLVFFDVFVRKTDEVYGHPRVPVEIAGGYSKPIGNTSIYPGKTIIWTHVKID